MAHYVISPGSTDLDSSILSADTNNPAYALLLCESCGHVVRDGKEYRIHRRHCMNKEHTCIFCSSRFSRKDNLYRHLTQFCREIDEALGIDDKSLWSGFTLQSSPSSSSWSDLENGPVANDDIEDLFYPINIAAGNYPMIDLPITNQRVTNQRVTNSLALFPENPDVNIDALLASPATPLSVVGYSCETSTTLPQSQPPPAFVFQQLTTTLEVFLKHLQTLVFDCIHKTRRLQDCIEAMSSWSSRDTAAPSHLSIATLRRSSTPPAQISLPKPLECPPAPRANKTTRNHLICSSPMLAPAFDYIPVVKQKGTDAQKCNDVSDFEDLEMFIDQSLLGKRQRSLDNDDSSVVQKRSRH